MPSCLVHTGDESVTLSAATVKRLLDRGDGDAALLYLALLRRQGTVPPRSLAGELRWDRGRIEAAETALRECLAIAADKAYLLTDRAFGGSDTLATSYILSQAIRKVESLEGKFDMIFCGKQAIDGDTAQVGPEIAEHLGMPQVTYALEVQEAGADGLKVIREAEDGKQVVGVSYPCLVTFTKPNFDPRFPTIKRKMAARKAVIEQITAADLEGIDLSRAGLKGSPTKVKRTYVPPRKKSGVMITGETPEECAAKLYEALNSAHII